MVGDPLGRHEVLAAGVVQDEIEPPVALEWGAHDALGAGAVADVPGNPRASPADLGDSLLEHVLPAAGDHYRSAATRQLGGRSLPEVRSSAGDERDLTIEHAVDEHARALHGATPLSP